MVIYVVNRFLYQNKEFQPQLVKGLSIVSDLIFQKERADCFSNPLFLQCLKEYAIDTVEFAGVDEQFCVGMSALGAAKHGFSVRYNTDCVGVRNHDKFQKMKDRLENVGVAFI